MHTQVCGKKGVMEMDQDTDSREIFMMPQSSTRLPCHASICTANSLTLGSRSEVTCMRTVAHNVSNCMNETRLIFCKTEICVDGHHRDYKVAREVRHFDFVSAAGGTNMTTHSS